MGIPLFVTSSLINVLLYFELRNKAIVFRSIHANNHVNVMKYCNLVTDLSHMDKYGQQYVRSLILRVRIPPRFTAYPPCFSLKEVVRVWWKHFQQLSFTFFLFFFWVCLKL